MPKKVSFFGQNFQLQSAFIPNFPLVERSHLYERVQLVEYCQNILVKHLDHSRNTGAWPEYINLIKYVIKILFKDFSDGSKRMLEELFISEVE